MPEPVGGAHHDHAVAAENLKQAVSDALAQLVGLSTDQLLQQRYDKFRTFGQYTEG